MTYTSYSVKAWLNLTKTCADQKVLNNKLTHGLWVQNTAISAHVTETGKCCITSPSSFWLNTNVWVFFLWPPRVLFFSAPFCSDGHPSHYTLDSSVPAVRAWKPHLSGHISLLPAWSGSKQVQNIPGSFYRTKEAVPLLLFLARK